MAYLTTRSVLLRQPQYSDYIVEETKASTSSRELDAGVHHRGSYQMHMESCVLESQLQCDECVVGWFDSSVEKRWRASRKAFE
jgi:hypothetical protein